MVVESVTLLVVCVLLSGVFARSKHLGYAVAVLPVATIPSAYLLCRALLYFTGHRFFGVRPEIVLAFAVVLGIAVTCALTVFFSRKILSKRNRGLYLVVFIAYTILLGWSFIYTTLSPLL